MSPVPGYWGCDCDNYNPDCRCHPRQETTTMSTQEPTMTEHDTTDHVAAIKALAEATAIRDSPWRGINAALSREDQNRNLGEIIGHTDALAAQLAETEARCQRLRGYACILEVKFAEEVGMSDADAKLMRPFYLADADLPADGSDDDE